MILYCTFNKVMLKNIQTVCLIITGRTQGARGASPSHIFWEVKPKSTLASFYFICAYRTPAAGVLSKFSIFQLCTMVILSNFLSKNTVYSDENLSKKTIVSLNWASWCSNQEWCSICGDTVCPMSVMYPLILPHCTDPACCTHSNKIPALD